MCKWRHLRAVASDVVRRGSAPAIERSGFVGLLKTYSFLTPTYSFKTLPPSFLTICCGVEIDDKYNNSKRSRPGFEPGTLRWVGAATVTTEPSRQKEWAALLNGMTTVRRPQLSLPTTVNAILGPTVVWHDNCGRDFGAHSCLARQLWTPFWGSQLSQLTTVKPVVFRTAQWRCVWARLRWSHCCRARVSKDEDQEWILLWH